MKYPDYDQARYKVWALPHPLVLHWVLNPGLAFLEIFLGQRLPRVILIDRHSEKPLVERSFVPCPHCGTLHAGTLWGKRNAFGHWLGYVCPTCGKTIPCLWNVFSIVVLALLSPFWVIPVWLLKDKWLEFERHRIQTSVGLPPIGVRQIRWIVNGVLYFGGMMWVLMGLLPELWVWKQGHEPNWLWAIGQLPVWLWAGFGWAVLMRYCLSKKGKAEQNPGR
jgi:hypothetical protein